MLPCFLKIGAQKRRQMIDNYTRLVSRVLLDCIAEVVLKTATQSGVVLDIELVKDKPSKKHKDACRYHREFKEATRLVKKLIYPQIDLKIRHNATFTTQDLLDVLVHVAFTHGLIVRVVALGVRQTEPLTESAHFTISFGANDQVPVIGHQAVRENSFNSTRSSASAMICSKAT